MSKITDKFWNSILPTLRQAARNGFLDSSIIENERMRPTHVLDIYKMRRGRYKNVRIWTHLNLGNGYRKDLFMTTADNQPIDGLIDIYNGSQELKIDDWRDEL